MGRGPVPIEYDPKTGIFTRKGKRSGTENGDGYRVIWFEGKLWLEHRLAFLMMGKPLPLMVDHQNKKRNQNHWLNLRAADAAQNSQNCVGRAAHLKGAYFDAERGTWYSKISVRMRVIWLGRHATEELAHAAYCAAANKHHGEFASHG